MELAARAAVACTGMEKNGVDYSAFQFAHPIEEEFARILDYYGIPWEYEPRAFALEWDDDGNVKVALK